VTITNRTRSGTSSPRPRWLVRWRSGWSAPATRRVIGVGLAALSGVASSVQALVNGELGARLDDGVLAALVSFGTGLTLMTILVASTRTGRQSFQAVGRALRGGQLRWWQLLGGVSGGFVVASQGIAVATLGVAVFTVALVAGQSGSSLMVDRAGLSPSGAQPVTTARVVGAGLCVLAVLVSVADQFHAPQTLWLTALPLLAGAAVAWQQAVNGWVRVVSNSVRAASLVNFMVGGAALLVGMAISVAVRGWPSGQFPTEPWLYTGGLLGAVVVAVGATVVRLTGVLLLMLGTISGQLLGALAVDLVAPTATPPTLVTCAGAGLALLAVLITLRPSGPRRGAVRKGGRGGHR
jgi:transporter family-2 protein